MARKPLEKPQTNGSPKHRKGRAHNVVIPGIGAIDGRTKEAWTYRAMVEDLAADLGGLDTLSRAQLELCRRAAGLAVMAAKLEGQIVEGVAVDVSHLVMIGNAQARILSRLGLGRRPHDVTPATGPVLDGHARLVRDPGDDS